MLTEDQWKAERIGLLSATAEQLKYAESTAGARQLLEMLKALDRPRG